ncbi:GNAT family N-acetyltransferase [Halomicroarcula sp. GCM10025709]|uniref:GNAT family N-acetyltransferase n=1 Tax=Haloarcula TaxID=2237 RepID=UPI0024C3EE82|nr:GNAT family N-acetyltransferase [Halomicroarcula sp. YJ-61-S]
MPFETPDLLDPSAAVPERLSTDEFLLRPLVPEDADIDYEAVTGSGDRLHGIFGPDDEWPTGLSEAQNRVDVCWHYKEHQRRDAFTYGVFDPGETVELGCLYVQPTRVEGYDAAVYYWVSDHAIERGLAEAIGTACRDWIRTEWPFERVAYPGRDVSWREWPPAGTAED